MEFLHTVQEDNENINDKHGKDPVARMLTVCGEFERIAKVVLDKAEKDSTTKRKRKQEGQKSQSQPQTQTQQQPQSQPQQHREPQPQYASVDTANNGVSSTCPADASSAPTAVNPMDTASPPTSVLNPEINAQLFGSEFTQAFSPTNSFSWLNDVPSPAHDFPVSPAPGIGSQVSPPPVSSNSFQQPFVPQDLWQMPMTFEWDWADVNPQTPWNDNQNRQGL
ncbi:hypothetical protein RUND412_011460 [Rhizina undulata]